MVRDMRTLVDQYLKYIQPGIKKDIYSSGASTTRPTYNFQGIESDQICTWEDFPSTVLKDRDVALNCQSATKLPSRVSREKKVAMCGNERQVEDMLLRRLFMPLENLMSYLGWRGRFKPRPSDALLDLDYGWSSHMESPEHEVVKIAIEVETFWELDLPDDLVAAIKREKMGGKLGQAVSQLHGYMAVNHLRYGVLATFETFIFFRRGHGEDDVSTKLEITKSIRRDQTRELHQFTLMEAWVSLVMAAEPDHIFTSSYPLPEKRLKKRQRLEYFVIKNPMELDETAKIESLYFGDRITRSQLGVVCKGGILGNDEKTFVMKVVDCSKSSKHSSQLDLEVSAYRELEALHEEIVPKVRGFLLISGWIKVLVLPDCGKEITQEQFVKHSSEIRQMVEKIHSAGVAHGDLAYRNILIDTKEKLTIIDFSNATLRKECKKRKRKFSECCEKDLIDLDLLQLGEDE